MIRIMILRNRAPIQLDYIGRITVYNNDMKVHLPEIQH